MPRYMCQGWMRPSSGLSFRSTDGSAVCFGYRDGEGGIIVAILLELGHLSGNVEIGGLGSVAVMVDGCGWVDGREEG